MRSELVAYIVHATGFQFPTPPPPPPTSGRHHHHLSAQQCTIDMRPEADILERHSVAMRECCWRATGAKRHT